MIINNLRTTSFRNLSDSEIFTGAKDVFLIGENGQGKTNFLEALYFCAYASSFRSIHDCDLAHNGDKDFSAEVNLKDSANNGIFIKFIKGKKSVYINGKFTEDRKELLSIAPCIVFCHEDMEFVCGSPERRRWFFDQTLSLDDPVYLEDLRRYRRVLKTRNTVLRDYSQNRFRREVSGVSGISGTIDQILDALDPQLAFYGQKLMEKREIAAGQFSGIFGKLYKEVSGITGITVQYIQSWPQKEDITALLHRKRAADIAAGRSLIGPHRDRYVFEQNGTEFAGKASTGQRRLLALLLRTAQSCRYSQMTGLNPILLLDDVLLEMDGEKRQRFLSVLPVYDQAFFTFLPEEPYQRYCSENTLIYKVEAGCLDRL